VAVRVYAYVCVCTGGGATFFAAGGPFGMPPGFARSGTFPGAGGPSPFGFARGAPAGPPPPDFDPLGAARRKKVTPAPSHPTPTRLVNSVWTTELKASGRVVYTSQLDSQRSYPPTREWAHWL